MYSQQRVTQSCIRDVNCKHCATYSVVDFCLLPFVLAEAHSAP